MNRAIVLAVLVLLLAGIWLLSSLGKLVRGLRFRFVPGKPYVPGSIGRATTSSLAALVLVLIGLALGGAWWGARAFMPAGTEDSTRLRVVDDGGGALLLEVATGEGDGPVVLAAGLTGESWELTGTIIVFPGWARPLGLGTYHRIHSGGPPGAPPRPLPRPAARAAEWFSGKLPALLQVKVLRRTLNGSGAVPVWMGVQAGADGYTLTVDHDSGG